MNATYRGQELVMAEGHLLHMPGESLRAFNKSADEGRRGALACFLLCKPVAWMIMQRSSQPHPHKPHSIARQPSKAPVSAFLVRGKYKLPLFMWASMYHPTGEAFNAKLCAL